MVRELFSCTEVIAYCISNKQENNVCNIKAIRNFSEIYSISRKSRYHSLLKLTEKEIVKKMGNTYEILNYDELHKLAFEVKEFWKMSKNCYLIKIKYNNFCKNRNSLTENQKYFSYFQ